MQDIYCNYRSLKVTDNVVTLQLDNIIISGDLKLGLTELLNIWVNGLRDVSTKFIQGLIPVLLTIEIHVHVVPVHDQQCPWWGDETVLDQLVLLTRQGSSQSFDIIANTINMYQLGRVMWSNYCWEFLWTPTISVRNMFPGCSED